MYIWHQQIENCFIINFQIHHLHCITFFLFFVILRIFKKFNPNIYKKKKKKKTLTANQLFSNAHSSRKSARPCAESCPAPPNSTQTWSHTQNTLKSTHFASIARVINVGPFHRVRLARACLTVGENARVVAV